MPESDCITLSDSDDEALEILEEKISNYGGFSAVGSKPIEVTKDMEKSILDSLRKQNVSIPEGNFKLKIYARNGGNVDLRALDLSAAITSSSLLKVNNKVSTTTTGKVSFVVSAPPPSNFSITDREAIKKKNEKSESMPSEEVRENRNRSNMLIKERSSEISNNKDVRTKVNITKSKIGESKRKDREIKSVTNHVSSSKSIKSTEKSVGINTVARPVGSCHNLDVDKVKNVVASENVQMFNMVRGKLIAKPFSQVSESVVDNEARIVELSKFSAKSKVKVQVSNTSKHVIEEQLNSKDQKEDASPVIYEPSQVMDEPSCLMDGHKLSKDGQRSVAMANDPSQAMIDDSSPVVRGSVCSAVVNDLSSEIVDDLSSQVVDDPSLHTVEDPGQEEVKDSIPQEIEDPSLVMMDDPSLEMTDASSPGVVADASPIVVADASPEVVADSCPIVVADPGPVVVADPIPVVVFDPSHVVMYDHSQVVVYDPSQVVVDDNPSSVVVDDSNSVAVADPTSVFEQKPSRVVMDILSPIGMGDLGLVVEENVVVEKHHSLDQKRKSSSTIRVKIPLLFEEIVDINIDSSTEEICSHPDLRPATDIDPYICSEEGSDIEVLTPDRDLSFDVSDTEPLKVAVQPNNESTDSTKPNNDENFVNRSSATCCKFSDSGTINIVETPNLREGPASNIATVDDYDLEDDEVAECFSNEMNVDEKAAYDTIKNILDTLISNISNVTTGRKEEGLQVVPNLEEYSEKDLENYLDKLPRYLHEDRFEDIFNTVPPSNDILKSAVANIQFIHDDLVQTSTDDTILPLDVEYFNEDSLDISSKFLDMDISTLSDIEELIKESELESEEALSFIPVEVLQNIVDVIDMNQLMSELKDKAYQHFKFSGWRLTHVSKKVAKCIPGLDITLYPHLTDRVQESFNDENLLCNEEVPEIPACMNKTLTELSQNGDLFDDYTTTGCVDVNSCIEMEKENIDLEEKSDITIKIPTSCFVSVKNIPHDSIPESLPSHDKEMNKSGAKYSSSVTLLPSSGPKDFLWQLNSQDFSSMFGLCTHSQADQIRAKSAAPAPTSVRLRRVNLNKSVNYNEGGSAKKRRKVT